MKARMSIWTKIGEYASRLAAATTHKVGEVVDAVRTVFRGDPELRRQVAFSVAMIALSAKMAKADGIVTQDEIRAFQEIFSVPARERRNVARLYDLARQDTAGFELYAERIAGLCGSGRPNCAMLEDILDGLFHIAKADGLMHEREAGFLKRIADISKSATSIMRVFWRGTSILGKRIPMSCLGSSVDAHFPRFVAVI
jgi:DnaJ like chaperone protein